VWQKSSTSLQCKKFQKLKFLTILGHVIYRTWPNWINFTILTFINEKNRYSKCLYKIWNKIISFNMRKKGKSKTGHRKSEEGEFKSPRSESLVFQMGYPDHAWTFIKNGILTSLKKGMSKTNIFKRCHYP
jgi:hypothetical protein